MCQLVPPAARLDPSTTYAPRSLMLTLMRKYQAQDVTGQMYIGTTDGILYIYPAVRLPEYAPSPRFRSVVGYDLPISSWRVPAVICTSKNYKCDLYFVHITHITHLLRPPYKRGTLLDPVDLFDFVISRHRYPGTQHERPRPRLEP